MKLKWKGFWGSVPGETLASCDQQRWRTKLALDPGKPHPNPCLLNDPWPWPRDSVRTWVLSNCKYHQGSLPLITAVRLTREATCRASSKGSAVVIRCFSSPPLPGVTSVGKPSATGGSGGLGVGERWVSNRKDKLYNSQSELTQTEVH